MPKPNAKISEPERTGRNAPRPSARGPRLHTRKPPEEKRLGYWTPKLNFSEHDAIKAGAEKLSKKIGFEITPSEFMRRAALEKAETIG